MAILFLVTGVVTVVISLMTEPIPAEKLYRLTFWTRKSPEVRNGFDDDTDQQEEMQEKRCVTERSQKTIFNLQEVPVVLMIAKVKKLQMNLRMLVMEALIVVIQCQLWCLAQLVMV